MVSPLKNSKILKVAGLSLAGFCAVSIGVDKANVGPVVQQLAGFCGAFVGGWVGARRRTKVIPEENLGAISELVPKAVSSLESKEPTSAGVPD